MSLFMRRALPLGARRYSTTAPPKASSNTGLYFGLAGVLGLAAYVYMEFKPAPPKVPLTSALDKDKWQDFKLKSIEHYNHNTAKLIFELPPNTASLLPVASCVYIKSAAESDPSQPPLLDAKGKPYVRPYTPISPSDKPEELEFLIKKYDTGKVTPFLHSLKPGQSVGIKGPIPKLPIKENEFERVGMIAGGSGITPMYQIVQHSLALPNDKTKYTLIFSNLSEADILLKETFDDWAKKHSDRFEVIYVVDQGGKDWKGPTGYVTSELVKQHFAPPSLGEKVKILVCGPPGQVASVSGKKDGMKQGELSGILKELGYTSEQEYKSLTRKRFAVYQRRYFTQLFSVNPAPSILYLEMIAPKFLIGSLALLGGAIAVCPVDLQKLTIKNKDYRVISQVNPELDGPICLYEIKWDVFSSAMANLIPKNLIPKKPHGHDRIENQYKPFERMGELYLWEKFSDEAEFAGVVVHSYDKDYKPLKETRLARKRLPGISAGSTNQSSDKRKCFEALIQVYKSVGDLAVAHAKKEKEDSFVVNWRKAVKMEPSAIDFIHFNDKGTKAKFVAVPRFQYPDWYVDGNVPKDLEGVRKVAELAAKLRYPISRHEQEVTIKEFATTYGLSPADIPRYSSACSAEGDLKGSVGLVA
ncbi:NADH-cytochrome b5 reductase [Tulasnella sp. 419]|nr:NADH-cytochrome b5 reductase [Tulasnella sp. 419]